jgi:hypothetical protein
MKSLSLLIFTALILGAAPSEGESMIMLAYYKNNAKTTKCTPPSAEEEKKLFSEIDGQSRQLYNSFDCEGKNRAIRYARQKCIGDECTIPQCEGTGKCTFKDKNEAVRQAAKDSKLPHEEVNPRYQDGNGMDKSPEQMQEEGQEHLEEHGQDMQKQGQQDAKNGAQSWGY